MTSSRPERSSYVRVRRRLHRMAPVGRRQVGSARHWATEQAAALPDHTHAAHLVGLVAPPPADLPRWAGTEVEAALEASPATCLQRCLVLQAWLTAHDRPLDVAIGIRTTDGFAAHAWIPGYHAASESVGYREMARVPPRGRLRASLP